MTILINWLLSALSLMIVAHVVRGFDVTGFGAALIAVLVIGLVNATIGLFLKIVTFPLTLLSLGVFWFVINALMLKSVSLSYPASVSKVLSPHSSAQSSSASSIFF